MKVSIITVCFNSAKTIRNSIDSVLSQQHENIEYIIVDGASSDETMEIVRSYGDHIAKVISERDGGIYDAMNKGVLEATGEIVGILNSDDFYEDDLVVSSVVSEYARHPNTDIVFGDVVFVRPSDLRAVRRRYGAGHFRPWKLRFGWMPPHPGTFVKRSLYSEFGYYKTDFAIAADYEIFVRWLVRCKASYRWIDKVMVRMRMGGASTSGLMASFILNREIVRACSINNVSTNMLFVLSKIPFKLLEIVRRPS
jgi:glycosyltransferase involved in cell wall biosynthesis